MRYIIILVFICCITMNSTAHEYLVPNSHLEVLNQDSLAGKTKSFYRYARNEIYAKKGYIFKDQNLNMFFSNLSWYKKNANSNIILSEIERTNVELLKSLEDSTIYDPYILLYKYIYNEHPLFYIRDKFKVSRNRPRWHSARFILLSKKYSWTINCSTIPLEFLIKNNIGTIPLTDTGPLQEKQISFEDIDSNSKFNMGKEVRINLHGPSDDHKIIYLGFDNNKNFKELIRIPVSYYEKKELSNHKILLTTRIRKNLEGTSFYKQDYLYDTYLKEVYKVPNVFLDPFRNDMRYISKISLKVYYDARSAAQNNSAGQVDIIQAHTKFKFLKFYRVEDEGSAEISWVKFGIEQQGWLSQKDINFDTIVGLSAAD